MALIAVELKEEELDEVVKKLTIYAASLVPKHGVVSGVGNGAEDLVNDTLTRWWDPDTPLKWNTDRGTPNLGGIIALLKTAMRNRFFDSRRKAASVRETAAVADDETHGGDDASTRRRSPEGIVARTYLNELTERVLALAEEADDVDVVCYVELQTKEGGPYKNQEAAERLGLKPSDVVNLRKRLDRYTLRAQQGAVVRTTKAK